MRNNQKIWQAVKEGAILGGVFALFGAACAGGLAALVFGFALTPVVTGAAIMGAVAFGAFGSARTSLTWALPDGSPSLPAIVAGVAATFVVSSNVPHPTLPGSSAATSAFTQSAAKAKSPSVPAASAPVQVPCFARQP